VRPAWLDISAFGLTQIIMLIGLFGLIVPVFPGIIIMWLGALAYGILVGWSALGIILFVLITLLMVGGELADNVLMGVGARKGGASWLSIVVALIAGVAGTLFWPPFGGIIAAPLAVLLLEYWRAHSWKKAWQAIRGLATGWGISFVARFLIGLFIMGFWWLWVWLG
jgi:uncharacterized protein YqgC (DUF456 family)